MSTVDRIDEYWEQRALERMQAGDRTQGEVISTLHFAHHDATREILRQYWDFRTRYETEQELSFADLKKKLTIKERKELQQRIREYHDEIDKLAGGDKADLQSVLKQHKDALNKLSARAHIARLEMLYADLAQSAVKLGIKDTKTIGKALTEQYLDGRELTDKDFKKMKIKGGMKTPSIKQAKAAAKERWLESSFSDRIWTDKAKLIRNIERTVATGFVAGQDLESMSKDLEKVMKTSENNTMRLLRTESMHVSNKSAIDSMKDAGVKRYKITAKLDARTSTICTGMNGVEVDIKDAKPGINYPPFHPNCRSTVIPIIDDEEWLDEIIDDVNTEIEGSGLDNVRGEKKKHAKPDPQNEDSEKKVQDRPELLDIRYRNLTPQNQKKVDADLLTYELNLRRANPSITQAEIDRELASKKAEYIGELQNEERNEYLQKAKGEVYQPSKTWLEDHIREMQDVFNSRDAGDYEATSRAYEKYLKYSLKSEGNDPDTDKRVQELKKLYNRGRWELGYPPLVHFTKEQTAFFSGSSDLIKINKDGNSHYGSVRTIRHEFGHWIDQQLEKRDPEYQQKYLDAAKKDLKHFKALAKKTADGDPRYSSFARSFRDYAIQGREPHPLVREIHKTITKKIVGKNLGYDYIKISAGFILHNPDKYAEFKFVHSTIFDILASMTNGNQGYGHDSNYYKRRPEMPEIAANIESIRKEFPELLNELFPNSFEFAKNTMRWED